MRTGFRALSFSILVALSACQPRKFNSNTNAWDPIVLDHSLEKMPNPNVPASVEQIWEAMRGEAAEKLQPGCEPARYSPPAGVNYRGVAILLHGFSACPQQFEVLGPQLAKAGYEVFVPLFPGHGAIPKQADPRIDNIDFVPKVAAGWGSTVARVNEISRQFKGEKVLVGLSMGSNIALRAYQTAPNLYDRIVVLSPKLRNETAPFSQFFSNSIHVLNIDEYVLGLRSGWKQCELKDSKPPANRAGFCNMENRNAIAMLDFGKIVIDEAGKQGAEGLKNRTNIQFILSHSDDGTCNRAAEEVLAGIHKAGNSAKVCIMPKDVPHSMFSAHDAPYVKPWVPALFKSVEGFLTRGEYTPGSQDAVSDCGLSW